jgi:hypothetical protein
MPKMRCLVSEASQYWEYVRGRIYEIPEQEAARLIALGKFERVVTACPHCGGELGGTGLETATVGAAQEVAVLPRAGKRG